MKLDLLYVHDTSIGYARLGVKLAAALERKGVEVVDHLNPDDTDPAHVACWVTVPTHATGWFEGQYATLLTMWESTRLPEGFRESLHNFDQLLVPSEQNLELFSRYHPNVHKLPLGVDSSEWHYRKRKTPTNRFVFLHGGSGARKGPDVVFEAFRKVFKTWPSDMPVPTLIFKSPKPCEYVGDRIEHIGGKISDQAEQDLYGMAHCYVQPSRGEGWGLQPLQAIAQGLPTILTGAHGHAEFSHLGYGISAEPKPSDYFIFGNAGDWWEPSLDELCQQMEYVYYHYDEACAFAEQASAVCHSQFTWERTADRFIKAVGRDRLSTRYAGTGRWYVPDIQRYLVRVARHWACEIAGAHFQFAPGRDYWEVADVKRILFEADVLDPSCLTVEAETGLTEKQVATLGDYSASMSYCHACGQKLGSGELYVPEGVR